MWIGRRIADVQPKRREALYALSGLVAVDAVLLALWVVDRMTSPPEQSDYWQFGDAYGPLAGGTDAPFRGRRLTWEEYERMDAFPGLGGRAFWSKVPDGHQYRRAGIAWIVGYGYAGSLNERTHQIVEHDDGTITVTPSLVIDGANGERWHGWLNGGVFTGAFEQ